MKYLVFYEWNYEDLEKISVLRKQLIEERAKGSDRFLKPEQMLFESHILEAELYNKSKDAQLFFICETDNPIHLISERMHFAPYIRFNFIPITESMKTAVEYLGLKR